MAKKARKKLKLNNSGSTLVLAILAIAFLSLLASVILAAAVGNVLMKRIDNNSKSTFYTAESVVDEIKVGVGKDSVVSMADAYEEVLSKIIVTGTTVDYMMDNKTANDNLKQLFMEDVTSKITGGKIDFGTVVTMKEENSATVLASTKDYLSKFISKGLDSASIESIESITFIKNYNGLTNQIIINNVVVNYKTEKVKDTYFADVTVDINIAYPNMEVDFSATDRLNDFREYALIADNNINIKGDMSGGVTANVKASIYSGANISVISGGANQGYLSVGPNTSSSGDLVQSDIVARGNLVLTGAQGDPAMVKIAKFDMMSSNLWCKNIELQKVEGPLNKDQTAGAQIDVKINETAGISEELKYCNLFVQDDLNITGQNSVVNIDGSYYGYSYYGVTTQKSHDKSSAIIVNGKNSHLTLGTGGNSLKSLVLGGHSYISYSSDPTDGYMTGESLSFTGNQEVYLIPSQYIGVGYKQALANPMPVTVWEQIKTQSATDTTIKLVDMTGFYPYANGLLDATKPYEIKQIGSDSTGLVYVYLNFKDKASATAYFNAVVAGSVPEASDTLKKYAQEILGAGTVDINIGDLSKLYTSGAITEASGANVTVGAAGTMTAATFATSSINYENRYKILSHLLVDLPFTVNGVEYIVDDVDEALLELKTFVCSGTEFMQDATVNIVDWSLVSSKGYNDGTDTYLLDSVEVGEAIALTKVVRDGDYTLDDDVYGGVIIANGDVNVTHDFKGLIIASGTINITNNATITTNIELVEKLITFEYSFIGAPDDLTETAFKNYLYAYKSFGDADGSDEEIKIESLGYDDLVSIDNWRKYDDR